MGRAAAKRVSQGQTKAEAIKLGDEGEAEVREEALIVILNLNPYSKIEVGEALSIGEELLGELDEVPEP